MPRSEETEWWINAVYAAIKEIPQGRVTTYKHIAVLLGTPQRARQVGMCLSSLPPANRDGLVEASNFHNLSSVPWQRVINSKGMISHRAPGWARRQAEHLRSEGVQVESDNMGENYIDLNLHGWFPDHLPDQEATAENEE